MIIRQLADYKYDQYDSAFGGDHLYIRKDHRDQHLLSPKRLPAIQDFGRWGYAQTGSITFPE